MLMWQFWDMNGALWVMKIKIEVNVSISGGVTEAEDSVDQFLLAPWYHKQMLQLQTTPWLRSEFNYTNVK